MAFKTKPAFRCNACGHLESAEQAGENEYPHACSCCGAGIRYDPKTGIKTHDPSNWEILADATKKRLKEIGIEDIGVMKHTARTGLVKGKVSPITTGRHVEVSASENLKSQDKAE